MILRVREVVAGGKRSPALKTPEPHSASTVWGIKKKNDDPRMTPKLLQKCI
jgi:hypothetical protein